MEIILRERIDSLGVRGDVVNVSAWLKPMGLRNSSKPRLIKPSSVMSRLLKRETFSGISTIALTGGTPGSSQEAGACQSPPLAVEVGVNVCA